MATTTAPRPPSVDALLREATGADRLGELDGRDRAALTAVARDVVAEERAALAAGRPSRTLDELVAAYFARWRWLDDPHAGPRGVGLGLAINATGVILHTNLGRAPWSWQAMQAALNAAEVPLLLELDAATGRRGKRFASVEDEIVAVTGAQAALVTNNNAAAVALAVGLAGRGGVAVSRGELVEIGGGVRIPEVIRRAGARLVEVGTTNRTRIEDFEEVARRRAREGRPARPPIELLAIGIRRGAGFRRPRGSRPPPRGDRRRRPRLRGAARHEPVRVGARAHAERTARRRCATS